jgi:ABC-type dipeptide/oligopeptide/nickel transport system permease component
MLRRLLRRLALGATTFLISTLLLYAAIRAAPGGPWDTDESTPQSLILEWEKRFHLDEGILDGYLRWLSDVVRGDLGASISLASGVPVSGLIRGAAPTSLALGAFAYALAFAVALGLGLGSARRPNGVCDRGSSIALYFLSAAPSFWIAISLQRLTVALLPSSGGIRLFGTDPTAPSVTSWPGTLSAVASWILPPLCLALGSLAFLFRYTRAALLDAVSSPYVFAARSRGVPGGLLIRRHAFAGTRIQMVTIMGLLAPSVIGGSVVIESVFALPGMGRLMLDAVGTRDYPVVMGVGVVMTAASIAASVSMDMMYLAAEPRLRTAFGRGGR